MKLTEFLTARLDEDEAKAREAAVGPSWALLPKLAAPAVVSPLRQIREADAKRKILALHYPIIEDYKDGDGIDRSSYECSECQPPGTPDNWPCPTVRALTTVYADHPDYDPAWAS